MSLANRESSTESNHSTFCERNPAPTGGYSLRQRGSSTNLAVGGGRSRGRGDDDGDMSRMLMLEKFKCTMPKSRQRRRRRRRRKPPIDDAAAGAEAAEAAAAVALAAESPRLSESAKSMLPPPLSSSSQSTPSSTSLRCRHSSPKSSPVALRLLSTPLSSAVAPVACPGHPPRYPTGLPSVRRAPSSAVPLRRWLLLVVLLVASANAYINQELVVQTNKGKVRGVTLKSATQR